MNLNDEYSPISKSRGLIVSGYWWERSFVNSAVIEWVDLISLCPCLGAISSSLADLVSVLSQEDEVSLVSPRPQ